MSKTMQEVEVEWDMEIDAEAVRIVEERGWRPGEAMDWAERVVAKRRMDQARKRKEAEEMRTAAPITPRVIIAEVVEIHEEWGYMARQRRFAVCYSKEPVERIEGLLIGEDVDCGDKLRITVEKVSE